MNIFRLKHLPIFILLQGDESEVGDVVPITPNMRLPLTTRGFPVGPRNVACVHPWASELGCHHVLVSAFVPFLLKKQLSL